MTPLVFLPGFDGDAALRRDFLDALAHGGDVLGVSYPNRPLGALDGYRAHAMGEVPVDWEPVLVAESFSGLVAARWAATDARVRALVLCGAFASNPLGAATRLGAALPALVRIGPALSNPVAQLSADPARRRWSSAFTRQVAGLRDDVIAERLRLIAAEDVAPTLAALGVPIVLLQFEDDLVIPAKARAALEAACPRARVLRLPGPHFNLEIRPRDCAGRIRHALAEALPYHG